MPTPEYAIKDAHEAAKEIFGFDIDEHAPAGSMDLLGADLLGYMVRDLATTNSGDRFCEVGWSDVTTRARYRFTYDPQSKWVSLTEYTGLQDLLRPEIEATRTTWYFNPEECRQPYLTHPDVMTGEVGRLVFLLSGGGNPLVGAETAMMHERYGRKMEQQDLDEVLAKLDVAFGQSSIIGYSDE